MFVTQPAPSSPHHRIEEKHDKIELENGYRRHQIITEATYIDLRVISRSKLSVEDILEENGATIGWMDVRGLSLRCS